MASYQAHEPVTGLMRLKLRMSELLGRLRRLVNFVYEFDPTLCHREPTIASGGHARMTSQVKANRMQAAEFIGAHSYLRSIVKSIQTYCCARMAGISHSI
jgi:hypothetical protein